MHVLFTSQSTKDIENAYFTLMWQLVQKLQATLPMPEEAARMLERCAKARGDVIAELGLSKTQGKQVLLQVINGGSPPTNLSGHDVILGLRKACIWMKCLAVSNLPDLYAYCCKENKPVPENSAIAYLYQAVEDLVLSSWVDYLMTLDLSHLSLHFDGCRIQGRSLDIESICQSSSEWIAKETGFQVSVKEKKHYFFLDLLKKEGRFNETKTLSTRLTSPANGILACLAYVTDLWSELEAWLEKDSSELEQEQRHRSYKECFNAAKLSCVPELGCCVQKPGKYLLHCEHTGSPLVLGCLCAEEACKVLIGDAVYDIGKDLLNSCAEESIDSASLVTFWLQDEDEGAKRQKDNGILLELQAGVDLIGGANLDQLCVCEGLVEGSDDEGMAGAAQADSHSEAAVRFGDDLLALLKQERDAIRDSTETVHEGRFHRCPLCPFRHFSHPGRVAEHVQRYHTAKRQFSCSGTKQIRIIQALFDDDQLRNVPPAARYLRRSAAMLRASVSQADASINHLDRHLRLVLTEKGPVYKSYEVVADKGSPYRRAKNLYYTHGFADLLYQEMMVCNAKVKQASRLTVSRPV